MNAINQFKTRLREDIERFSNQPAYMSDRWYQDQQAKLAYAQDLLDPLEHCHTCSKQTECEACSRCGGMFCRECLNADGHCRECWNTICESKADTAKTFAEFFTDKAPSAEERAEQWKQCAYKREVALTKLKQAVLDLYRETRGDGGYADEDGLTAAGLDVDETIEIVKLIANKE
jgi:hypothetical protein